MVVWVEDNLQSSDYEIIGFSFEVKALTVPVTPGLPNLNGTYTGTVAIGTVHGAISESMTMTIVQNGISFSGTWMLLPGGSGSVSGTFSGTGTLSGRFLDNRSFSINLVETSPCSGNISGSGSIFYDGHKLIGGVSGENCDGDVEADFNVTRN